jgi:hypothetical protein
MSTTRKVERQNHNRDNASAQGELQRGLATIADLQGPQVKVVQR